MAVFVQPCFDRLQAGIIPAKLACQHPQQFVNDWLGYSQQVNPVRNPGYGLGGASSGLVKADTNTLVSKVIFTIRDTGKGPLPYRFQAPRRDSCRIPVSAPSLCGRAPTMLPKHCHGEVCYRRSAALCLPLVVWARAAGQRDSDGDGLLNILDGCHSWDPFSRNRLPLQCGGRPERGGGRCALAGITYLSIVPVRMPLPVQKDTPSAG